MSNDLPYEFIAIFEIYNKKQILSKYDELKDKLLIAINDLELFEDMCDSYNIDFKEKTTGE